MPTLSTPPTGGTRVCPKCGNVAQVALRECPSCQVVIDKALQAERRSAGKTSATDDRDSAVERLAHADALAVKQQVEQLEAWTGLETANRYAILDGLGVVFHAEEQCGEVGQLVLRNLLKAARPFTMQILNPAGEAVFTLERPFRVFFSELRVTNQRGRTLGRVERRFAWLRHRYTVTTGPGGPSFEINGPMFKPWTFYVESNGVCRGQISKRWSGLGKELFTDADTFGIEFPPGIGPEAKAVLLGAVFLIDFAHFEDHD